MDTLGDRHWTDYTGKGPVQVYKDGKKFGPAFECLYTEIDDIDLHSQIISVDSSFCYSVTYLCPFLTLGELLSFKRIYFSWSPHRLQHSRRHGQAR